MLRSRLHGSRVGCTRACACVAPPGSQSFRSHRSVQNSPELMKSAVVAGERRGAPHMVRLVSSRILAVVDMLASILMVQANLYRSEDRLGGGTGLSLLFTAAFTQPTKGHRLQIARFTTALQEGPES